MTRIKDTGAANQAAGLAGRGQVREAFTLLQRAAADGDALACAVLGEWRMSGALIRRDLAEARDYYALAAKAGLDQAAPFYIALLASGPGGSGRDWTGALDQLRELARRDPLARRQRDLITAMATDDNGDPISVSATALLREQPFVRTFEAFLSSEECRYLIDAAAPRLTPAMVINPATGQQMRNPIRSARSASFPLVHEDPAIHAINRRIAVATGTTWQRGEPTQVLSYDPGDEYKLHSDALPAGENQRTDTFLVWLNDDFNAGETAFPHLGLKLRGRTGDALHFANVKVNGAPDQAAVHAGLPVTRGRKMMLSKWIRAAPLDLSGPPGRPF